MKKIKYYSLTNILKYDAQYNVIFGGRSNGKSYAVQEYCIKDYIEHGRQMAVVRRWQDDFTGKRGLTMFDNQISTNNIKKLSNGQWDQVYYHASRWYLARWNEDINALEHDDTPFAFGFSITSMEHDKSSSYPKIGNILFDEFLTRSNYIDNEFVLFMNVLSTIIRQRDDVRIFMLGNTVNKYCPYFAEMGLNHIKEMEAGSIDLYTYGNGKLKVAVEYTTNNSSKPSDKYFAFDNPKLNMITGNEWEIDIYPHLPDKYKPSDILFTYFIQFDGQVLQCEIIQGPAYIYTYIHIKTSPLKDEDNDLIFGPASDPRPNWIRKINRPLTPVVKKIYDFFQRDKVYYQSNDIGEIVRNYLQWCS